MESGLVRGGEGGEGGEGHHVGLLLAVVRGTTHTSYSVPGSSSVRLYRGSELLDTRI